MNVLDDSESRIPGTTQRNDVGRAVSVGCELRVAVAKAKTFDWSRFLRFTTTNHRFRDPGSSLHIEYRVPSVRSPDRIFLSTGERKSCLRFTDSFRAQERVWCHSPSVQFPVGTDHLNSSLGIDTCVHQGKSFAYLSYQVHLDCYSHHASDSRPCSVPVQ